MPLRSRSRALVLIDDEIGLAYDADRATIVVRDRHAADALFEEQIDELLEPEVGAYGDRAASHDLADPAMAPTALTIRGNRPLRDVANELADEKIGALPIVDADGKLIGIVSYVDALRALAA